MACWQRRIKGTMQPLRLAKASKMLLRLRIWHREKSWDRGLQDRAANARPKVPAWASKLSYQAGYAHRERELACDAALFENRLSFHLPLSISASTDPSDYEVESSEHWPRKPPPLLSPEKQAEDRSSRAVAALIVLPCWIFHKNDADPWPSTLHGHHNERPLKLDAISGFVYSIQTRGHVQTLRPKELARIQAALFASKDFSERARSMIGIRL
jgi:hypothetical protein